jgi:flagellar biosynthesis anti-sigma factor FlgM
MTGQITPCTSSSPPAVAVATQRGSVASDKVGAVDESAATSGVPQSDVHISSTASARASAPLDTAKVKALRAAVLYGSYTVNAGAIADHLIGLDKNLP